MHVAILSMNAKLHSTQRLKAVLLERGHTVRIINVEHVYMSVSTRGPTLRYKGEELEHFDAVIPRIGASVAFYGLAVLRQFEMLNVYALNSSTGIARTRDRLQVYQMLAKAGIPIPKTGFACKPDDVGDMLNLIGSVQLEIKLVEGNQRIGSVITDNPYSAASVVEGYMGVGANILVHEGVSVTGTSMRCFVVGKKVVAACLSKGQHTPTSRFRITPEERIIAVRATKTLGLKVAGVDIVRTHSGFVVTSVIPCPELEHIETVTEKDIAGCMVRHIEKMLGFKGVEKIPEPIHDIPGDEVTANPGSSGGLAIMDGQS